MTFLNATLLLAVGAAAVPIVLHLIAKREPKKVVFPSIRFLTKTYESNRAKLRVRRWWLLALRIAALAALALALARPVIHQSLSTTWLTIGLIGLVGCVLLVMATVSLTRGQSSSLTWTLTAAAALALISALAWGGYTYGSGKTPSIDNDSPAAVAIVLDNSLTASWKIADEDRIARIKQIARTMIARLPATSRIAVIDRSSTPAVFSLDVASALSKVDQIQPLAVTQPIATKIDASFRLVRSSDLENRQLLVITDLAQHTWGSSNLDSGLAALTIEKPEVGITVFDLGAPEGLNRVLSLPRVSDTTPTKGVPIPVTVNLDLAQSPDDRPVSVTAELELFESDPSLPVIRDGQVKLPNRRSVDRKSVEVSSSGRAEVLLTIPPLEVGVQHGRIRLVGDDAMAADDVRYISIEVMPPSHLLLVGNNADEAAVIGKTITAPFAMDDPSAEYLVERVGWDDLPAVQMDGFDAVIALDPQPDALADESLAGFVENGGSVFVCLGRSLGNDTVALDHLPTMERTWRIGEPHTYFVPLQTSHPVLSFLNEIPGGVGWGDFGIRQYWQVTPAETDQVLMRYAGTEHPALLKRPGIGDAGSWYVLTTPIPDVADAQRSWNDLYGTDAWPAFLLVRRIAEVITGRGSTDLMPLVGQPQIVDFPVTPVESETRRLQVFAPDSSSPVPIDVQSTANQVAVNDVTKPGTYWLRGAGTGIGFSANVGEGATRTDRIAATELDAWFGEDKYVFATDETKLEFAESESAHRVSLRSPIMLLALAVFLLELILGNRFYRSRSTSRASQPKRAVAA